MNSSKVIKVVVLVSLILINTYLWFQNGNSDLELTLHFLGTIILGGALGSVLGKDLEWLFTIKN